MINASSLPPTTGVLPVREPAGRIASGFDKDRDANGHYMPGGREEGGQEQAGDDARPTQGFADVLDLSPEAVRASAAPAGPAGPLPVAPLPPARRLLAQRYGLLPRGV